MVNVAAVLGNSAASLEDALQRITGEDTFDAWLDDIPADIDPKFYIGALGWMLTELRSHSRPTVQQIDLTLTITRMNLNFNPDMDGTDQGRGYFTPD